MRAAGVALALGLLGCGPMGADTQLSAMEAQECTTLSYGRFPTVDLMRAVGVSVRGPQNYRIMEGVLPSGKTRPGHCSSEFASKWRAAMACAAERLSCLDGLNGDLARRIREAMRGSGGHRELIVSCTIHTDECGAIGALTRSPRSAEQARTLSMEQMLNEELLGSLSKEELCTAALHEAMHWAREPKPPRHDEDVARKDRIYSCSRYCNGCERGPTTSGIQDCIMCAGTQLEKTACGQSVEVFLAPPLDPRNACKPCTRMRWNRPIACDGTALPGVFGTPPVPDTWPGIPMCCEDCGEKCEFSLPVGKYDCPPPPMCNTIPGPPD